MTRALASLLLCLPLHGGGAAEDLVYAPDVGTVCTKTFRQVFELRLVHEEQVFAADGLERKMPAPDGSELVLKELETVTVTDSYLAVEDDRPTRILRRYDELGTDSRADAPTFDPGEPDFGPEPDRGRSPLEGREVQFDWNPQVGLFDAAFVGDEGAAPELLDGLVADAGLAWFLPGRPVQVGDSWNPAPTAFTWLTTPLGDTKIERPGDERAEREFGERFGANVTGVVRCTLREVSGGIASITIAMEIDTFVDESSSDGGLSRETSKYTYHFELAGELRWDVVRSRAAGLTLAGPARLTLANEQTGMRSRVPFELRFVQDFEGTLELDVEVR